VAVNPNTFSLRNLIFELAPPGRIEPRITGLDELTPAAARTSTNVRLRPIRIANDLDFQKLEPIAWLLALPGLRIPKTLATPRAVSTVRRPGAACCQLRGD